MEEGFILDDRLKNDGFEVIDLKLCKVMLVDNVFFLWVTLIPRVKDIKEIIDLSEEQRITLMDEISFVSQVMQRIFSPDKLNIAALGNIVPQLHIHIIARYKDDIAFPQPVFGQKREPYPETRKFELISIIRAQLLS